MKKTTFEKLKTVENICNREKRSIEYTIQYMQDYANVDYDCVMAYLYKTRDK